MSHFSIFPLISEKIIADFSSDIWFKPGHLVHTFAAMGNLEDIHISETPLAQ